MNKYKIIFLIILCLFVIAGCSTQKAMLSDLPSSFLQRTATEQHPLRVAVQAQFCSSMVGLIVDKGWDQKAGIPFKLITYPDGTYLNQGLEKGEWDIAVTGGAFIYAMVNSDAMLIGHQIDGTGCNSIYVRKGSSVLQDKGFNPTCPEVYGSPKTVKGLHILQNDGTTSRYLLESWLESIGVPYNNVFTIQSDFSDTVDRFNNGEGDCAAITTSKGIYVAKEQGWVEAVNLKKLGINMSESILCTKEVYKTRYEDIDQFLKLIYSANDTLLTDKELQYDVVEKWYADTGNTTNRQAVKNEVDNKTFIGTQAAEKLNMLEFAMNYAESLVKMGVLSPEDLSKIKENTVTDMLYKVLENKR